MTDEINSWRETFVIFSRTDVLTGEKIRGTVMVRTINGQKQYRRETESEAYERWAFFQW